MEICQPPMNALDPMHGQMLHEVLGGKQIQVGGFDTRNNAAQVECRPSDARAEAPRVCAVLPQTGERFGLKPYAPDESDARKQIRCLDTDPGSGSRERALRGTNVRAAAQKGCGIAWCESWQG